MFAFELGGAGVARIGPEVFSIAAPTACAAVVKFCAAGVCVCFCGGGVLTGDGGGCGCAYDVCVNAAEDEGS